MRLKKQAGHTSPGLTWYHQCPVLPRPGSEKFPSNLRADNLYHASWLSPTAYDYFVRTLRIQTNCFSCPNRNLDGAWIEVQTKGTRVGFY